MKGEFMPLKTHILKVWGDLACFTRPEMKVERFSYPVITPSSARGIFDAIYCKSKEFRWQITKIELLSQPSYIALRRNEVKDKISEKVVTSWMGGKKAVEPIWADGDKSLTGYDTKGRTQRQTMALKDVCYRLHAKIIPRSGFENQIQGLEAQFRRRASKGKCIYQPYLGCREFPAYFELIDNEENLTSPLSIDMENLGWMLYDVFDLDNIYTPDTWEKENHNLSISLFKPVIKSGIMNVPYYDSDEVHKGVRRKH